MQQNRAESFYLSGYAFLDAGAPVGSWSLNSGPSWMSVSGSYLTATAAAPVGTHSFALSYGTVILSC